MGGEIGKVGGEGGGAASNRCGRDERFFLYGYEEAAKRGVGFERLECFDELV
jgi:hypothetical protein